MANMKNLFAAVLVAILCSHVYGQEQVGQFCTKVKTHAVIVPVDVAKTTYETVRSQPCSDITDDDKEISRRTINEVEYCDFNRSTITLHTVNKTEYSYENITECCKGYSGATCTQVVCDEQCENGGICSEPNKCNCSGTGYEGDFCEKAQCNPRCVNGACLEGKECSCDTGWKGIDCTQPACDPPCQNNGNCTGPNECTCPEYWKGRDCTQKNSPCEHRCFNGGTCSESGVCICPEGYDGEGCSDAICEQECKNGGRCSEPNECQCPNGFYGMDCGREMEKHFHRPNVSKSDMRYLVSGHIGQISKPRACISWNSNQYMTFDGKQYFFPGRCIYNLASHVRDLFHIRVNNAFECLGDFCKRSVIIEEGESTLELYPNGTATHNNVFFDLPKTLPGRINVEPLGRYTVAILSGGEVEVSFDNDMMVLVRISDSYKNHMTGLCGNFDGDIDDEFTLLDGSEADNVYDFGNRMGFFNGDRACDVSKHEPLPCYYIKDDTVMQKIESDCSVLEREKFSACHDIVDVQPYVERCRIDACSAGPEYFSLSVCGSLTSYSRICSYHGVILSWRGEDLCPMECSGGKIYSECGSTYTRTCGNYDEESDLSDICVDGCVCPLNKVLDTLTNTCVYIDDCPCTHSKTNETYFTGNIIFQECNECKCQRGRWTCTDHPCPKTCKMIGEDHYQTFDGKDYQFSSDCEHVLVQTKEREAEKVTVTVENRGCGFYDREPCEKTVNIRLYDLPSIRLRGGDKVYIGPNKVALPYNEKDGKFKIFKFSSVFLRVLTKNGSMDFLWDQHHRMYLKMKPDFKTKVHGLCGTYNQNQGDDLTLPNGLTTVDVTKFGNEWGTNRQCCITKKSALDGCSLSSKYRRESTEACGALKSDLFTLCNRIVSPDTHISMCESDVCRNKYKGIDINIAKCTIFSDYERLCTMLLGGPTSDIWRDATGCEEQCERGMVFQGCVPSCQKTCQTLGKEDETCEDTGFDCFASCACPEGMVLDESADKCVEVSHCPCYHQNVEYLALHERRSRCENCICKNGEWNCYLIPGCDLETLCTKGQVWSHCTQCQRTCDNQHVECEENACKEGCACPEGTTFYNDTCIKSGECPCSHLGRSYKSGEVIDVRCNKCTCQDSTWSCTGRKCPGVCMAYGDPHYITFDNKRYEFHGACTYVLAEDFCGKGVGTFRVSVENVACSTGGLTCTKAVRVQFHDTVIVMVKGSDPIATKNPMALRGTPIANYQLEPAGIFWRFKTWTGIEIMWDRGTRVYIKLASKFMGEVCGLCGNFNEDASDDFTTRQGVVEQHANKFGNGWKWYHTCPDSEKEPIDPCAKNPHRRDWAKRQCEIIKTEVFSNCHATVDPEPYYRSCIWDACGCDRGGDCECLCTAIAAYARDCSMNGQPVKWRSRDICGVQCENGTTYSECATTRADMCFSDPMDEGLSSTCVEGCHCPAGLIMRNGNCIKQTSCPCRIDGREVPPGYTVSSSCSKCTCTEGQMKCYDVTCPGGGTTTTTKSITTPSVSLTTTTVSVEETTTPMTTSTALSTGAISTTIPGCPYGKIYDPCPKTCQDQCHYNNDSRSECSESTDGCMPACVCPGRKVLNENGTCVEPMDCDCRDFDGYRIQSGEMRVRGCKKCKCFDNKLQCDSVSCQIEPCGEGMVHKTLVGSCCPTCVLVTASTTLPPVTSTGPIVTGTPTIHYNTTVSITTTVTVSQCNETNGEIYETCKCEPECGKQFNESCIDLGDEYGKCCVCENGTVRDESGKCVDKEECFCSDDIDKYIPSGKPVPRGNCQVCYCMDGNFSCSARCSIDGCGDKNKELTYDAEGCCSCKEKEIELTTTPSSQSTAATSEITTTTKTCMCNESYVPCDNCAKCVKKSAICDGIAQCQDGSDEVNCNCIYEDKTIMNDDSFTKSKCEVCTCIHGKMSCNKDCNKQCSPGYDLRIYDDDDDRCCECVASTTAATSPETTPTSTIATATGSRLQAETTTNSLVTTEVTTTTKEELTTKGICDSALGMESGKIKPDQLSASSSYFGEQGLNLARYADPSSNETGNYWFPEPSNDFDRTKKLYFQVNFNEMTEVTGITTQRGSDRHFVKKYSVEYLDSGKWTTLTDSSNNDSELIFEGNTPTLPSHKVTFLKSIVTKGIQIVVKEHAEDGTGLKFELHGCAHAEGTTPYLVSTTTEKTVISTTPMETEKSTTRKTAASTTSKIETTTTEKKTYSPVTETVPESTTTTGEVASTTVTTLPVTGTEETTAKVIEETTTTVTTAFPSKERCHDKMGIDANKDLRPGIHLISSTNAAGSKAEYGRLHNVDENGQPKAWFSETKYDAFLGIQSDEVMNVTAVLIQGDGVGSFIKRFRVHYRKKLPTGANEWDDWKAIEEDGDIKTFPGLQNATEVRQVDINQTGIEMNEIHIRPIEWHKNIALRFELLGCYQEVTSTTVKTTTTTGEVITTEVNPTTTPSTATESTGTEKPAETTTKKETLPTTVSVTTTVTKLSGGTTTATQESATSTVTEEKQSTTPPPATVTTIPSMSAPTVTEETTTTVTTSFPPEKKCHEKMGMDANDKLRPGIRFRASSNATGSKPEHGRLNNVDENGKPKAWNTIPNLGEYLEIESDELMNVTAVLIQGDGVESFVKHFTIRYRKKLATNEWDNWHYVEEDGDIKTFPGVKNATEIHQVDIDPTGIEMNEIRLIPTAWHKTIALRTELLGCYPEVTTTTVQTTTTTGEVITEQSTTTPSTATESTTTEQPSGTTTTKTEPTTVSVTTTVTKLSGGTTTVTQESATSTVTEEKQSTTPPPATVTTTPYTVIPTETTRYVSSTASTGTTKQKTTAEIVTTKVTTASTSTQKTREICATPEDLNVLYTESVDSSSHTPGHDEEQSFFKSSVDNSSTNGWTPNEDIGNKPYIEYTFNKPVVITTVITRDELNEKESGYEMTYLSGSGFTHVTEHVGEVSESNQQPVDVMRPPFNDENAEANWNYLDDPITTTKVRLYPGSTDVQIKVALYGCLPEEVTTTPVVSVTSREVTITTTTPVTELTTERTTSSSEKLTEQTSSSSEKPTEQTSSSSEKPTEQTSSSSEKPTEQTSSSPEKPTGTAAQTSNIVSTTTEKSSTAKPTTIESVTVETTTETIVSASSQAASSTPNVPTTGSTKVVTTTTREISTIATKETPSTPRCDEKLGMDVKTNSKVNFDIVTSDVDESEELRDNVRLNSVDSWTPITDADAYVGVVFNDLPVTVTAVLIQEDEKTGDHVSEFVIQFITSADEVEAILDESGDQKLFIVNYNDSGIDEIKLPSPLEDIKEIRIVPKDWEKKIAIRMDLKGCFVKEETTTATQTSKMIVTTKTVLSTPTVFTGSPTTSTESTGASTAPTESTTTESTTPVITVTTTKTMPVTSEVTVTSAPKFSTTPTSATSRTTEKVTSSQRPTTTAIVTTTAPSGSTPVSTTSPSESTSVSTTAPSESTSVSLPTNKPTTESTRTIETTSETTEVEYTTQVMCDTRMGMRFYHIPDESITATSSREGSKPEYARNIRIEGVTDASLTDNAWSPDQTDENPHLQVEFPDPIEVTALFMQGDGHDYYTPKVSIKYKPIGDKYFEPVMAEDQTTSFTANSDAVNVTKVPMPPHVFAKVFRIYLERDNPNDIVALRVEFGVCVRSVTVPVVKSTTTETVTTRTTQKSTKSTASVSKEFTTSMKTETSPVSEIIQTTTKVTEKTSPLTTPSTEQPTQTTTTVTTTKNLTEATSTEITETVSQSTVETTEESVTSLESTTSPKHPTFATSTAVPVTTLSETTQIIPETCDEIMELKGKDTDVVTATYSASSNEDAAKYASFEYGGKEMWHPDVKKIDQTQKDYVEVEYDHPVFITTIETEGSESSNSTQSYTVQAYAWDAKTHIPDWVTVALFKDGPTKITTKTLEEPIRALSVRITVINEVEQPALRFSVTGCFRYAPIARTTTAVSKESTTQASVPTATSETTTPKVLVSTKVIETSPVTTTRSAGTASSAASQTTTPIAITQSSGKPEVTTSVTVSTKTAEISSTTEEKIETTASPPTQQPTSSTASTGQVSTTTHPISEETTSRAETATTEAKTPEKPTTTPIQTTSIVETTTEKVETVETTTIRYCGEGMGRYEVDIPEDSIMVSSSSEGSESRYIKSSYNDVWEAAADEVESYVKIVFSETIPLVAIENIIPSGKYFVEYQTEGEENNDVMIPIRTDLNNESSEPRTFDGSGTTVLEEPIDVKTIKFDLKQIDRHAPTLKVRIFSCRTIVTVPGTTTTTVETVTTTVVPTTISESTTKSTTVTSQPPTTSTGIETTQAPFCDEGMSPQLIDTPDYDKNASKIVMHFPEEILLTAIKNIGEAEQFFIEYVHGDELVPIRERMSDKTSKTKMFDHVLKTDIRWLDQPVALQDLEIFVNIKLKISLNVQFYSCKPISQTTSGAGVATTTAIPVSTSAETTTSVVSQSLPTTVTQTETVTKRTTPLMTYSTSAPSSVVVTTTTTVTSTTGQVSETSSTQEIERTSTVPVSTTPQPTTTSATTTQTEKVPTTTPTVRPKRCEEVMDASEPLPEVSAPDIDASSNPADAKHARINSTTVWHPVNGDGVRQVVVTYEKPLYVTGVTIQGDGNSSYVSLLSVTVRNDSDISEDMGSFNGNTDAVREKSIEFPHAVLAKIINIVLKNSEGQDSLRFAIEGCFSITQPGTTPKTTKYSSTTTAVPTTAISSTSAPTTKATATSTIVSTTKQVTTSQVATSSPVTITQTEKIPTTTPTVRPKRCEEVMDASEPLPEVLAPDIDASSNSADAKHADINSTTVWHPANGDDLRQVVITYEKPLYVTGVTIQGDGNSSYVSLLSIGVYNVSDTSEGISTSFDGNSDALEEKTIEFHDVVLAKVIEIVLHMSEGQDSLRFRIEGCFSTSQPSTTPKTTQYSSSKTSAVSSTSAPTTKATATSTIGSTTAPSIGTTTVSTKITATTEGHTTEEKTTVTETKVTTAISPTGSPTPVVIESTKETTVSRTAPSHETTTPVETTSAVSVVSKETTVTTPITHPSSTTEKVPKTTSYVVTTTHQTSKSKPTETPYSSVPTTSKEVTTTTSQQTVETTETPVQTESSTPGVEITTRTKATPVTSETIKTTEIPGTHTTTSSPVIISTTNILRTSQPTVPESTTTIFISKPTKGTATTTLAQSETSTQTTEIVSRPAGSTAATSTETPVQVTTTVTTSNVTKVTALPGPCNQLLGKSLHAFTEETITSSTEKLGKEAKFAIISDSDGIYPAWSPEDTDPTPSLTVTFIKPVTVYWIVTQGGGGSGEFVRSYTVSYVDANSDSGDFVFVNEDLAEAEDVNSKKTFSGNTEAIESVETALETPINVTAIRIHPLRDSAESITMRVDFRGCEMTISAPTTTALVHTSTAVEVTKSTPITTEIKPGTTTVSTSVTETKTTEVITRVPLVETTTGELTAATSPTSTETSTTKVVSTTTTVTTGSTTEHPEFCEEEMKNSTNKTISSTYYASSNNETAENGRLNVSDPSQSWHPSVDDNDPRLIIDFNDTIVVASVKIRGSVNNETGNQTYVTKFVLDYFGEANGTWQSVNDDDGNVTIFVANTDGLSIDTATLKVPISTKKLRMSPRGYVGAISLCVEVVSCNTFIYERTLTTTSKMTVSTTETPINETSSKSPTTATEAPVSTTSAVLVTSSTKVYPTTQETVKPGTSTTKSAPEISAISTTSVYVKSTEAQPSETTTSQHNWKEKTATTPRPSATTSAASLSTGLSTHTEILSTFSQATTKSPQPVTSTAQPEETEASKPVTGTPTMQQTTSKSTTVYPTTTTVLVVTSGETNSPMTTAKVPGTTTLATTKPPCQDCTVSCVEGQTLIITGDCCRCSYSTATSTRLTVTSALLSTTKPTAEQTTASSPTPGQTTTLSPTTPRSCENKTCPSLAAKCGKDGSECPDACNCGKGTVYDGTKCIASSRCLCYSEGIEYEPRQKWNKTSDNCYTCACIFGKVECTRRSCRTVNCGPQERKETPEGECCERCVKIPVIPTTSKPPATSTPSTEITATTTGTAPGNETTTATITTVTSSLPTCPSICDCYQNCNGEGNCTDMLECLPAECNCADSNIQIGNGRCAHRPPAEECEGFSTTTATESTTSSEATTASTTAETPIIECYYNGKYYKISDEIENDIGCTTMICGRDGIESENECLLLEEDCDGEIDYSLDCCDCIPTATSPLIFNATTAALTTASQSTTGVHTTTKITEGTPTTTISKETPTASAQSTPLVTIPAITCISPLVPTTCGCNRTCYDIDVGCSFCEVGCFCPPGYVMDGKKCIPEKKCPCTLGDKKYPNGGTWTEDICMSCNCTDGERHCKKVCNEKCTSTQKLILNEDSNDCCYCKSLPVVETTSQPSTTSGQTTTGSTSAETTTESCNGCVVDGHCYNPENAWNTSCDLCVCMKKGEVKCLKNPPCQDEECEPGYHLVPKEGHCCKVCDKTCPGEFNCGENDDCIPENWYCDGQVDCKNSDADEENCSHPVPSTTPIITGSPTSVPTTTAKTPISTTAARTTVTTGTTTVYLTSTTAMVIIPNITTTAASTTTGYECIKPFVPSNCACTRTCRDLASNVKCSLTSCEVGCQCPHGYVEHNGECITKENCPCYDLASGKVYSIGEIIESFPCQNRTCNEYGIVMESACNKECKENQYLVEGTEEKCCYCKEATCHHDGTNYTYGLTWQPDNCTLCKCNATTGKPSCGEYCGAMTCPDGYDLVNPDPNDHECCKCRPKEYCLDTKGGSLEYRKVGDKWTRGVCEECKCAPNNEIDCLYATCAECPQGFEKEENDQMCCPPCVPIPPETTTPITVTLTSPNETTTACPFRCNNGICIPEDYICDMHEDCPDGEDEDWDACGTEAPPPKPATTTAIPVTTSACEFRCNNSKCISMDQVCNQYPDCEQGEDENEMYCSTTTPPPPPPTRTTVTECEFKCNNGKCIPLKKVCNQYPDCADEEDENEMYCGTTTPPPPPPTKTSAREVSTTTITATTACDGFVCANETRCIPWFRRCDSIYHCSDHSDEIGCAGTSTAATTTVSVTMPTTKPTCKNECDCYSDCDGGDTSCKEMPGCNRYCECRESGAERTRWRCVTKPPKELCPTTQVAPTSTAAVTTTTGVSTTTPNVCDESCTVPATCKEMEDKLMYVKLPVAFELSVCTLCECASIYISDDMMMPGACFKTPPTCEGCTVNGTEYETFDEFPMGTCQMCQCHKNEATGEHYYTCDPKCQLTDNDCIQKGMVLVNNPGTCCECRPAQTTQVPPTSTAAVTTPPRTRCNDVCVVKLTCEQSRNKEKLSEVPFEVNIDCEYCLCPSGTVKDIDVWNTKMCLSEAKSCPQQCQVGNKTYEVNETFTEGMCEVCKCLYKDGNYTHECMPFCQVKEEDCSKEGKVLENSPDVCCGCVERTTTVTPPSTTAPSTPAQTTTSSPCPSECYCDVFCDDISNCTRNPMCPEDCTCPDGNDKFSGLCGVDKIEPAKCVPVTSGPTATTMTPSCYEGSTATYPATCQHCICEDGNYNCDSFCNLTCEEGYKLEQAENACCYCSPQTSTPQVTTFSMSTTYPMTTSQRTTGPTVGGCVPKTDYIQVNSPDHPGCISEENVTLTTCAGTCESHYKLQLQKPYIAQNECTCCKPTTVVMQSITLKCLDGPDATVEWPKATACSCSACDYNPLSP